MILANEIEIGPLTKNSFEVYEDHHHTPRNILSFQNFCKLELLDAVSILQGIYRATGIAWSFFSPSQLKTVELPLRNQVI